MRFAVAVKQVPDTMEMSVDENGSLVRACTPWVPRRPGRPSSDALR